MEFCKISILLSAVGLSLCIASSSSVHSGIEAKATTSGINFLKDAALKYAESRIINYQIPDFSGEGGFKFSLTNVTVDSLSFGKPRVTTVPPNQFRIFAKDLSMRVNGNFNVEKKLLWWTLNFDGKFRLSAKDIDSSLNVQLAKDSSGRPRITALSKNCSASIGYLTASLKNTGIDRLANFILGLTSSKHTRNWLAQQICPALTKFANEQSEELTRYYNGYLTIPEFGVGIDTSLVHPPLVTPNALLVDIIGRVFPINRRDTKYPLAAPPPPEYTNNSRMFHFVLGNYAVNSFLYSLWKSGSFVGTFSQSTIPIKLPVNLTTDILSGLVRGLRKYNDRPLKFKYNMPQYPNVSFSTNRINLTAIVQIEVDIVEADYPDFNAFTIDVEMEASGNVSISNHTVTGQLSKAAVKLALNNSNVGVVPVTFFNLLTKAIVRSTLLPAINKLGNEGLPIKPFMGVTLKDEEIYLKQDSLEVATNIDYV